MQTCKPRGAASPQLIAKICSRATCCFLVRTPPKSRTLECTLATANSSTTQRTTTPEFKSANWTISPGPRFWSEHGESSDQPSRDVEDCRRGNCGQHSTDAGFGCAGKERS